MSKTAFVRVLKVTNKEKKTFSRRVVTVKTYGQAKFIGRQKEIYQWKYMISRQTRKYISGNIRSIDRQGNISVEIYDRSTDKEIYQWKYMEMSR